jgi:hypothetical protein
VSTDTAAAGDATMPSPDDAAAPPPEAFPDRSAERRRALWVQASELIVDTGYNYRAHLKVGQKRREQAKWLGIPRVAIPVAASAGTALLALIGIDKIAVAAFGFIGALVVVLEKYIDPIGQANAHTDKGNRLLTLYKDLRFYRNTRLRGTDPVDQLEHGFAALLDRGNELRSAEPRHYPDWAYERAKAEIGAGHSSYTDDPLWQDPPDDLP